MDLAWYLSMNSQNWATNSDRISSALALGLRSKVLEATILVAKLIAPSVGQQLYRFGDAATDIPHLPLARLHLTEGASFLAYLFMNSTDTPVRVG